MMGEDQRREVREIAFEVGKVLMEEYRKEFAVQIQVHRLECQGSQLDVDDKIALHATRCLTTVNVNARENQAKGAGWVLRLAYGFITFVIGLLGVLLGIDIGGK